MKLTRSDRAAFVHAVMQDVPAEDWGAQLDAVARDEVLPLVVAHPHIAEVRHAWGGHANVFLKDCPETAGVQAKMAAVAAARDAEYAARMALQHKLEAAIGACSTLAAAQKALPEFEKYLPKDRTKTGATSLPAVANLVADLTKLGWPKDKKPDATVTE
jgi:hypothetical protein